MIASCDFTHRILLILDDIETVSEEYCILNAVVSRTDEKSI